MAGFIYERDLAHQKEAVECVLKVFENARIEHKDNTSNPIVSFENLKEIVKEVQRSQEISQEFIKRKNEIEKEKARKKIESLNKKIEKLNEKKESLNEKEKAITFDIIWKQGQVRLILIPKWLLNCIKNIKYLNFSLLCQVIP